jgi:SAM-dependent methyltransferase
VWVSHSPLLLLNALQFITTMAGHTARTAKPPPDSTTTATATTATASTTPSVLGEEWSSVGDLEDVLERYLFPLLLTPNARVAEIGVGGGRVARYVRRRCAHLTCLDLSPKMLARAKAALLAEEEEKGAPAARGAELEFVLVDPQTPAAYPARLAGTLDVVYAFDVLVHVDLHVMFQVFRGCRRLLKLGGKAFFSTANLLTPAGWRRFECQAKYTAAGFYCELALAFIKTNQSLLILTHLPSHTKPNAVVCPAMVDRLLAQAGFRVVQRSDVPDGFKELADDEGLAEGNLYEGRDYLVCCEAVAVGAGEAAADEDART